MTIETRFNKGQTAFIIENDGIISLPVHGIEFKNWIISYTFLKSKALTMADRDNIIYRDEKDCFKSIDELANFYKTKVIMEGDA